jgi:DNA mismatch endonuclease (patch repair protein)
MGKWPGDSQSQRTPFGGLSRGQLMSRVRSTGNRSTEMRLSALLRKAGLVGWRRQPQMKGSPDFAWSRVRVAVFVDGCFWHGHNCRKSITPRTNTEAWQLKIERNQARDRKVARLLRRQGWKVLRVWECRLASNPQHCISRIRKALNSHRSFS